MKIISEFKDYYDYVAFQYGIDNSIVYDRKPFKVNKDYIKKKYKSSNIFDTIPSFIKWYSDAKVDRSKDIFKFKWLIITGRKFLLVSELYPESLPSPRYSPYKIINGKQYETLTQYYRNNRYSYRQGDRIESLEYYHGNNDDSFNILLELSRELNAPIFEYDGYDFGEYYFVNHEAFNKVPNLQNLGIASIYPPEQLYQDLSYFLGNIMKNNPDIKPPVEIGNNDKIVGHGFDIKESFRHRK